MSPVELLFRFHRHRTFSGNFHPTLRRAQHGFWLEALVHPRPQAPPPELLPAGTHAMIKTTRLYTDHLRFFDAIILSGAVLCCVVVLCQCVVRISPWRAAYVERELPMAACGALAQCWPSGALHVRAHAAQRIASFLCFISAYCFMPCSACALMDASGWFSAPLLAVCIIGVAFFRQRPARGRLASFYLSPDVLSIRGHTPTRADTAADIRDRGPLGGDGD